MTAKHLRRNRIDDDGSLDLHKAVRNQEACPRDTYCFKR